MSEWENRSLYELATSQADDRYDVLAAFGAPPSVAPEAQLAAPGQAPPAAPAMRQAAESQFTVGPDGKVHGRATYQPSGLIPDGQGGGTIIQARPPAGQPAPYNGQPGPYSDRTQPTPGAAPDALFGGTWNATVPTGGTDHGIGSTAYYNQQRGAQPGTNGAPVLDAQRAEIIRKSLYTQFNPDLYWGAGALGGLTGATVFPWAMDKLFTGDKGGWLGQQWRQNYSPVEMEVDSRLQARSNDEAAASDARKRRNDYAFNQRQARGELKTNTTTLETALTDAQAQLDQMKTTGITDATGAVRDASDMEIMAQTEKVKLFTAARDPKQINRAELPARVAMTPDQLGAEKFLTPADQKLLTERRDAYDKGTIGRNGRITAQTEFLAATDRAGVINKGIESLRNGSDTRIDLIRGYTDADGRLLGQATMNRNTDTAPWYENVGRRWNGDSVWSRGAEGVLAASVGLGLDYVTDRFNGKDHYPDKTTVFQSLDGPLMAAGAILPKNPAFKLGAVVSTYFGMAALDKITGTPNNATYSELLKPNWAEGVGMGIGWMTPFRSPLARVAAVGVGWAVGKALNIPGMYGIPIPGIGSTDAEAKQWDNVTSTLADFGKSPSLDGFKHVVDTGTTLGMSNEAALGSRIVTFDQDHASDQTPRRFESLAALDTSLGNMWLQRGTKLSESDANSHNDKGRILPQWQYDLGGDAAGFFTSARDNLALAANYLNQSGANPSDVSRVQQEQAIVQAKLNQVYGAHNIQGIYNELLTDMASQVGTTTSQFSIDQLMQYENEVKRRADNPGNNDAAYRGKLYRDLALLDVAIADFKAQHGEGEGARMFFAQGSRYLAGSAQFDANSADAQQLQGIADTVGAKINPAIDQQYQNGFNNPYGQTRPR